MNNLSLDHYKLIYFYPNEINNLKQGSSIWLKCPFCKNGKVKIEKGETLQVICNVEGLLLTMTKLEQKLIELGYEVKGGRVPFGIEFRKVISQNVEIVIFTDLNKRKIREYVVPKNKKTQEDRQQAFNVMLKDLKELRMYEERN